MKFQVSKSIQEIASLIKADYFGNEHIQITGINEIHNVEVGDICFVDHPKYFEKALSSAASVIIINEQVEAPLGKAILVCDKPFAAFNLICTTYNPFIPFTIEQKVYSDSIIMNGVCIHEDVEIGTNCILYPGVILYSGTRLGNNVVIHANTVIGADAFYYNKKQGEYTRMHSCGNVVIEDNVEIGALCTIDKGVTSVTRIGKGTKIDNQIHIGHDTRLGENCLLAASTVIAGCVVIGNNVTIWGQVAISSSLTIGDNVEILAKSGINKDLEAGKRYFGAPAEEARTKMKEMALLKRLLNSIK